MTPTTHARPRAATAVAHPNIALVKYWGKRPGADNIPATPSLSIALGGLATRTTARAAATDTVRINGRPARDAKVAAFIAMLRETRGLPPLAVSTVNDFPTGAGLASSAAGFAALVSAVDAAFGWGLSAEERSRLARRGSVSAARSVYGGFVALDSARDRDPAARPVLDADAWPLEVVVAIVSEAPKAVASTPGMERSRRTSAFYDDWTRAAPADFQAAHQAVAARDFEGLATVAEHSCLKMHAVMLATRPPLWYWSAATIAVLQAVRGLREGGAQVFFSVDAGPQVKAVCAPGHGDRVARGLAAVPGVLRILRSGVGGGARCEAGAVNKRE